MSATVGAALKKIATYVLTDKKALKAVLGAVLVVVIAIIMPIVAVLGIFSGSVDVDMGRLEELLSQNYSDETLSEIEEKMLAAGHSHLNVKEAQVLYSLVLFPKAEQADFVGTLVSCFAEGQTDDELIAKINATFGTNIVASEYTSVMQKIREEHMEPTQPTEGTAPPETDSREGEKLALWASLPPCVPFLRRGRENNP